MTFLLSFHMLLSATIFGITTTIFGFHAAKSFLLGSFLMLINLALIHFSWKRILEKKLIALSVGVIVFKYATLGFIIYRVASYNLFDLIWFSAGLGMVVPTAIAAAYHARSKAA